MSERTPQRDLPGPVGDSSSAVGAAPAQQGAPAPGQAPEAATAEDYLELVLDLVAQIPSGWVSTYGAIADAARVVTGRGSARTVGRIMGQYGGQVPWWRVVTASGAVASRVSDRGIALLRAEGAPLTGHDPPRVDLRLAGWEPEL